MSRHGTYDPVYGFLPEDDFPEEQKPQTNADRIRDMTDEELARRIAARTACMDCILLEECNRRTGRRRCVDMWLDWLKSPVEPEEVDGEKQHTP